MPLFTPELEFSDDYPTIEPSLKLDFANARALDPRITFTRASTATYVGRDGLIKTAGEDEARFDHDPATGESLGLLIEDSRTNLLPQSQQYTSTYWNDLTTLPTGWTTTAGPAPDGTDTVTTWNSGNQIYEANVSYSVGPQYTASVFVKDMTGGGGSVRLGPDHTTDYVGGDPRVTFQPSTQSFTTVGSGVQGYGYHEYPNGWYRVWFKYTLSVSDNIFNIVQLGAYNIGIWGAQVEEGAFPTSYIPTSGATVTRAKDEVLITGERFESWINKNEGTWLIDFRLIGAAAGLLSISNTGASVNERYMMWNIATDGQVSAAVVDGGVLQTNNSISFTPGQTTQFTKAIFAVKENDFAITANGLTPVTDNSGTVYNSPTQLRFAYGNGANTPYAHFKTCIYYPKRLTNAQLQTLTQ